MKLPRIPCGTCGRPIAAGPVAGRLGKGRVARHDAPGMRARNPGALVSCRGSLAIVDLPVGQMEFPLDETGPEEASVPDAQPVLF
ncbi:hypothetical protein [Streptomyces sp. NPDC001744]|uniref:hypothetical protein n=1 Tax=Streptomyces sp. NPDC001744 TaxID=3364606 RepID=UPI0036D18267